MPESPHSTLLLSGARIVGEQVFANRPVDVRVRNGSVTEVAPKLSHEPGEFVVAAAGRWLIPGLYDQHVHMRQWAQMRNRLDLSSCTEPHEVCDVVKRHWRSESAAAGQPVIGMGFRQSTWSSQPEPAALDAVSGDRACVLIAGDGHSGWLNTAAARFFGVADHAVLLDENEWFEVFARLDELEQPSKPLDLVADAVSAAHRLGIVGITDFEYRGTTTFWPEYDASEHPPLRVYAGFYAEELDLVRSLGKRTGDALSEHTRLGPLKIIFDGSLGTLTAYCCEPYGASAPNWRGKRNLDVPQLHELFDTANRSGFAVALHAIGDAAIHEGLDAFEQFHTPGSIEHAQLIHLNDIERMHRLSITASVQPAHLLDDRDVAHTVWADRAERCFALESMHRVGVSLAFGSDAPIAPLDPWLAIDAAVTRARRGDEPWNAAERVSSATALFASTNGEGPIQVASRADLVLLDHDPLTTSAREVRVAATIVDGRVVFSSI